MTVMEQLSFDELELLDNAIIQDCDKIIEYYTQYQDDMEDSNVIDNHIQNAEYIKEQLKREFNEDRSEYVVNQYAIRKWLGLFVVKEFYMTNDNKSEFIFPKTKEQWQRIMQRISLSL